jgi:hypothetical protein
VCGSSRCSYITAAETAAVGLTASGFNQTFTVAELVSKENSRCNKQQIRTAVDLNQ